MSKSIVRLHDKKLWRRLSWLSSIAGVAYASWPLGYIFNPSASKQGLASALEALNQPYNWVFIALDIVSSVLILFIALKIWQKNIKSIHSKFIDVIVANIALFSFGTIADTILPEHCLPGAASCPSWHQDHMLLLHGIFSIIAAINLFIIILIIWWHKREKLLYFMLVGYSIFALLSLYEAVSPISGNFSQHYYLTLCGIWIAFIPYSIRYAFFVDDYVPSESKKSKSESSSGKKPLG